VLGEWSQVWGSAVQLVINLVGIVLAAAGMLATRRMVQRRRPARPTPDRERWRRAGFRG
jgi:hypothetical protein